MTHKLTISSIILLILLVVVSIGAHFLKQPRGVSEFGPLKFGIPVPMINIEDPSSYPYIDIPGLKFYVFAVQKGLPTACRFEECGMSGAIVACMDGWLSGDQQDESADSFGLNIEDVLAGKASIIVVADKNSKIVGIYPNSTTHNIPTILQKHPELSDHLDECLDYHLPR